VEAIIDFVSTYTTTVFVAHADAPYNRPFLFTCYDLIFGFTPVIIFLRINLHNGR
jgi:hypothetical protein